MSKKLTTHSDAQEIRQYLSSEDKAGYELSEELEAKLDKIQYCTELIEKGLERHRVVEELRKKFGVGRTQGYQIYEETDTVFSVRQIRIDKTFAQIEQSISLALAKQDGKALAACIKNKIEAIKLFHGDK